MILKTPVELTTSVANLDALEVSNLTPYHAIYLGNIYCRRYERNFLEDLDDLRTAVEILHAAGKKAYVSTYAAPLTPDLDQVRRILEVAAISQADAVEVHNLGVLRIVAQEFPSLRVHMGAFANVYTDLTARKFVELGAARITPNYEVSLAETDLISSRVPAEFEILIHGKMSLGVSESCFLLTGASTLGLSCPEACQEEYFLRYEDWELKSLGKGVTSGRDICMLEHIPHLLTSGYRVFRIETISETPAYQSEVGRVYADAIARAESGQWQIKEEWWDVLRPHSSHGFCNGFYFGRSGRLYVNANGTGAAQHA